MILKFFLLKTVITILLCVFISLVQAQSKIESYVKQNTVAIKNISPDSIDYSELEVIGKAIGNARVVMLGEQDHGDAPTFLAKTRLIKYLHEKKGFNVLAFESDFFGLNQGWEQRDKTVQKIDSFLQNNIFPVWTFCDACSNLFYKYIPATHKTNDPLQVSGFDNQMILQYTTTNIKHQLDSVFQALQLPVTKNPDYTSILSLIDLLPTWSFYPSQYIDSFSVVHQSLQTIRTELLQKVNDDNVWLRTLDNLIAETIEYEAPGKSKEETITNTRDSQMAINVKWLADVKYPNEKIIVWAANYHIANYKAMATKKENRNTETMGSFFMRDSVLKNKTYILGFTSYQGSAGRIFFSKYKIPKARQGSFSDWLYSNLHYAYAFTDFTLYNQTHTQKDSFLMRGLSHGETKLRWTDIFNGMFYIQDMYPCGTIHNSK